MNHIEITEKHKCSGCSACMNICPTNCIKMKPDEEGFIYPNIDESKCIECGLCISTCPFISESEVKLFADEQPQAYALYHKNEQIRQQSTSGGAFTAICETFCGNSNYAIFGAGYGDGLNVCHSYVKNIDDLGKFRKSKYVQSEIGMSFTQAKQLLNDGKKVLFSGTPCQIAGLKTFLRKPYDNLITVDLVCHGVPTPIMFDKYKAFMERTYKDTITAIDFRNKRNAGWENSKISIHFNKRKPYERHSLTKDDPFMNAFLSYLCFRPSCYYCPFAKTLRVSDITIGDFWGIEIIKPELNDNKGLSLVLVNTQKGRNLFKNVDGITYIESVDLYNAIKFNGQLKAPVQANKSREQFMSDLKLLKFETLIQRYLKPRPLVNRLATKFLSKKTKQRIKRIIGLNH
ncbi:MAG: Coenzyme F420 hydrogenase/dehydrogenase, beta subunit C-terminal domain [Desulfosporosinus sp.]|nr:Coenzyme F420 hydrogenase/dehydrogenase, beta subunit C-terminal domain [Desulfosporosinus sp.]